VGARSRALAGVAFLAALAFGMTPPRPISTVKAAPSGGLRLLWSVRGLMDAPSAYMRVAVHGGLMLAWAYEPPKTALVALDLRTGQERWRMPMPAEGRPEIALAGDLALVQRTIGVTAIDVATGRQRWTRRLCGFRGDLTTVTDKRVGVGRCGVPEPPGEEHKWHPQMSMAIAIDLTDGRELWRRETTAAGLAITAAGGIVYLAVGNTPYLNQVKNKGVTVSALDARSGIVRRSYLLAADPDHIQPFPGDATRALFFGSDIAAVSLADGRVWWRKPAPLPLNWGVLPFPRTEVRDGRLVVGYESQVRELDLRSGATIASWDIPWADKSASQPVRQLTRPAPGGGALVIKDAWQQPAVAFQFGKSGAAPTVAALEANYEFVMAVEEGVVVVLKQDGTGAAMQGYAAF